MLVLSRKIGGKLYIPSLDIVITIVDIDRGKVRIGIDAPHGTEILQEELLPGRVVPLQESQGGQK